MEVDHFNPKLYGDRRHNYDNLMWSTRICNNAKRKYWPTKADEALGARFLNPCKEWDYGKHIAENPITHELIGKTPEGRYHIRMLRLNDETFVWERQMRAEMLTFIESSQTLAGSFPEILAKIRDYTQKLDILIDAIPYELSLSTD